MPKWVTIIGRIGLTIIFTLLTIWIFLYWLDKREPIIIEKEVPIIVEKQVIVKQEVPVFIEAEIKEWEMFEVTGYSLDDSLQGTNSTVAIGLDIDPYDFPVIAVDPRVIPLYSIVRIKDIGSFIAIDTGGLIKGKKIDILFDTKEGATAFGVQQRLVRVVE